MSKVGCKYKRTLFSYITFVDNSKVVSIHGQHILKVCIFVFRKNVLEDTLFGRGSNIDSDELILGCILIGKEIEGSAIIGDARQNIRSPLTH